MFIDYLMALDLSLPIVLLFLAAMLCFIVAFGAFLREVAGGDGTSARRGAALAGR